MVDDIERINFEALMDDPYGPMLKDWKKREDDWSQYRYEWVDAPFLGQVLVDHVDAYKSSAMP